MREIVEQLCLHLGRPLPRLHIPSGLATALIPRCTRWRNTLDKWLRDDVYCGRRFAEQCAFEPQVALADGLRRQVAAYRATISSESFRKAA
jgi:hypothetical protein